MWAQLHTHKEHLNLLEDHRLISQWLNPHNNQQGNRLSQINNS